MQESLKTRQRKQEKLSVQAYAQIWVQSMLPKVISVAGFATFREVRAFCTATYIYFMGN